MRKTLALEALTALSQETRLDVFRLLVKAGTGGLPAGQISERLGVRQNTLSTHLAMLAGAGLVTKLRQGRVIRYSANYRGMRELMTYLLKDCCRAEKEICQPVVASVAYANK